jgi:hypothetical protein
MDRTHLTAGDPFHHIDVISERVNNQVIPLCFCLMTGKTVENYSAFFKTLKEAYVQLTGEKLQPEKIVLDFEITVMLLSMRSSQESSAVGVSSTCSGACGEMQCSMG